jgi:hypothetical protein
MEYDLFWSPTKEKGILKSGSWCYSPWWWAAERNLSSAAIHDEKRTSSSTSGGAAAQRRLITRRRPILQHKDSFSLNWPQPILPAWVVLGRKVIKRTTAVVAYNKPTIYITYTRLVRGLLLLDFIYKAYDTFSRYYARSWTKHCEKK